MKLSELKILVTKEIPEIGLNMLKEKGCELILLKDDQQLSDEEFSALAKTVNVVLSSSKENLNEAFFKNNRQLAMISQLSAGFDNVAVEVATSLGIPVGHTPQAMNRATSDIAFGLMIATARNFFQMHKKIVDGETEGFRPKANLGQELYGKTLGVFGLGAIGFEMARKCKEAYGMRIIYCNRSENHKANDELEAKKVSFEDLLEQSDVLSVHSNLSESTLGIFDEVAFRKMKTSSIFINTSRGKVHDEMALTKALALGWIWGAGLDVSDPEPMDSENPLLVMPNVCVLPHIGSATIEARDEMSRLAAENIIRYFTDGSMTYCVNSDLLKK